jgi:hypothetical protein
MRVTASSFRLPALLSLAAASVVACASGAGSTPSPSPATGGPPVAAPSFPPLPFGEPAVVVPRPGTLDPHDVPVEQLEALVEGRHIFVRLAWTSGVEPCYVLDSVVMRQDGTNIELTVREGTGDRDAICIEIAQVKSTILDLGEFEPGTYTISAFGNPPPVTVEVV